MPTEENQNQWMNPSTNLNGNVNPNPASTGNSAVSTDESQTEWVVNWNIGWEPQIDLNLDWIQLDPEPVSTPSEMPDDVLSVDNLFSDSQAEWETSVDDNTSSNNETQNTQSSDDDWLAQEDKAVQESENISNEQESVVEPIQPQVQNEDFVENTVVTESETVPENIPSFDLSESHEDEASKIENISSESEQPAVVEDPVVSEEHVVAEDPVVAEEHVVAKEPVVAEDSPVAEEPVVEGPVVVEEPVIAEESTVAENPVVVEEPAVVEKSVVAEKPVVEEPAVTEEPVVEEPVVEWKETTPVAEEPEESLVIENVWTSMVTNQEWDIVSDTWDLKQWQNSYIPNESDFQKMSDLLENSKPWQVDISNVQQNTPDNTVNEVKTAPTENKWVFNLDYVVSSLQDNKPQPSVQNNVEPQAVVSNDVNLNQNINSETIQTPVQNIQISQPVENVVPEVAWNMPWQNVQPNYMWQNVQPNYVWENVQPNYMWQNVPQNVQTSYVWAGVQNMQTVPPMQQPVQPVQPAQIPQMATPIYPNNVPYEQKNKRSAWPIVILFILLGLWAAVFILWKMYPDVMASILWKDNIIVEYLNPGVEIWWDEEMDIDQNTWDIDELENVGNTWEVLIDELTWDEVELEGEIMDIVDEEDDIIDPDTLAAAILAADQEEEDTDSTWENITEIHGSSIIDLGDIDTYKDLWDLIDEKNFDKNEILKKLNDYKSQWTTYQKWWNDNGNQNVYKYGTYILQKCDAMIDDIEKWWEIDNNTIEAEFQKFDGFLSTAEKIKSWN